MDYPNEHDAAEIMRRMAEYVDGAKRSADAKNYNHAAFLMSQTWGMAERLSKHYEELAKRRT